MMRYGIPAYRMPRDVLDAEIARIAEMGVRMVTGHRVNDLDAERRDGGFDAVFVAVGAHLSKRVDLPTRDAGPILDAVSFLRDVASGETPDIGKRVAVYGGGNTAMDAARVARRLGAEETVIVYRRTREQMPAHEQEAADAESEGVRINWLRTITAFDGPQLQVEAMELDESGYPQPTGRLETLTADSVILALGQESDTDFLKALDGVEVARDGVVQVSPSMMTGCPGVFAGGDMVPSERTVTVGVGHGKKAARHIDAWLRGQPAAARPKHPVATFDKLHLWYFGDAAVRQQPELTPRQRVQNFDEVVGGLTAAAATYEAGRCLSCGNCFECDGCLGSCPEDAIIKLGKGNRYRFDYDKCTGCGACYDQCPVHAIEMVAEPALMQWRSGRDARDGGRQRSSRIGGLPAERGLLHLSDHPLVTDGRARRRMVQPRPAERVGFRPDGRGDAERRGSGRRAARLAAKRCPGDDVHRLAGAAADDPEHVQDCR